MPLQIEVTWENPAHPLLSAPSLGAVAEDGAGNKLGGVGISKPKKAGVMGASIPDAAAFVTLTLAFDVALSAATTRERDYSNDPIPEETLLSASAPAVSHTVLEVRQRFLIANGSLVGIARPPSTRTLHPLIASVTKGSKGTVGVRVRTEFVDVTPLWNNRAADSDRWQIFKDPAVELVVMGYTGAGGPLIWFALFPTKIEQREGEVSCLVFFRPTGHYAYTAISQSQDMYPINRYFVAPMAKAPPVECWRNDQLFAMKYHGEKKPVIYRDLCVGFGRSLALAGRDVILIYPLPSAASFGDAAKPALGGIVDAVVRLLVGMDRVAKDRRGATAGRLGLAGFSSGGGQLLIALNHLSSRAREVFAFDCHGLPSFEKSLRAWMKQHKENQLRMTGGHSANVTAALKLKDALVKDDKIAAARVSASPPNDTTFWATGGSAWWDHTLKLIETADPKLGKQARAMGAIRHQFAMFGGDDPNRKETYLTAFLKASKL